MKYLLVDKDQGAWLQAFVKKALEDLAVTGTIAELREIVRRIRRSD